MPLPKVLGIIAGILAALTAMSMFVLWPGGDRQRGDDAIGFAGEVYDARVETVTVGPCKGTLPDAGITCATISFRLGGGPDEGRLRTIELPDSPTTPNLDDGDEIVVSYNPDAALGFEYGFYDRQRRSPLLWLGLLFAVAVVALGRWRGLAALAGLGMSIIVLLVFILPAILRGTSPVWVALVGSSAIAFVALYLVHGFRTRTTVAVLSTLASLGATVLLASLFTALTELTGFASEEAILVALGPTEISLSGLVLAGMVIGALGALDDVTVTQAAVVWELRAAEPAMGRAELIRAGLRIGTDHVAAAVNTLVLAYAGAALPLLLLFSESGQSLGSVANSEIVATEIVRALVGSIGLVLAVPIATLLAALAVTSVPAEEVASGAASHSHGH